MTGNTDQPGAESRSARVRRLLIEPLERDGLRRARQMTVAAHQNFLRSLEERVGYLGDEQLGVLCEMVERAGQGPARDEWPSPVVISHLAAALAPKPAAEGRLLPSWMRSAAGREAWDEAPEVAVELLRYLEDGPPIAPPAPYHKERFRREARASRHRAAALRERAEAGWELGAEDAAWLAEHDRDVERARALVFAKSGTGEPGGDEGRQ